MKYLLLCAVILIAPSLVGAQTKKAPSKPLTIKTDARQQLDELNKRIEVAERQRLETEEEIYSLLQKYTEEYVKVKEANARLTMLSEEIERLYVIRNGLLKKVQAEYVPPKVPKTQIEFLRLLVRQNEEIIQLLRAIKRNTEN